MQAVGATRGGGHLGYIGVNHDVPPRHRAVPRRQPPIGGSVLRT
ncbi:hypothetical protein [Streptomyces afghaniensis]